MFSVDVLSLPEVAAALKVCPKTVYRLIARGKIRRVPGIRHVRVTRKALDEFLNGAA